MVGYQNYWVILQSSENSKRNRERNVNTLGGNMLGLLREVRNFILFRIHDCVVKRSLNWKYIFCFILLRQKFSVVSEQTTINHGFWIIIHISICAEIYSLYVMIDIFDILIVFIKSEKWRTIKRLCRDWYIYIYIYDVLCAIVLLTLYRLSIMFSIPILLSCVP